MATQVQLIVVEVIFMFILVAYLLRYYKSPSVSWDVLIATYISWSLGFAGTVLLPFDMAVTLAYSGDDDHPDDTLIAFWIFIYWR
jgi:hypothetical protein